MQKTDQFEKEYLTKLMLLDDARLDEEILKNIKFPKTLSGWVSCFRILTLFQVHRENNVSTFPAPFPASALYLCVNFFSKSSVLKRYFTYKKWVLRLPGRQAVKFVRRYSKDDGRSFCLRVDYCRRKAEIRRLIGDFDELDMEAAIGGEALVDFIVERLPEGEDAVEAIKEFAEEVSDEVADFVVPGALFVKVFKYGMNDLCPCCQSCDGTGRDGEIDCLDCLGEGLSYFVRN